MTDPLESILRPPPTSPAPPELFAATVAALRQARRRQRARRLAALAACAAALAALAALLTGPPPGRVAVVPGPPPSAVALEWRAVEGPGPAAPVYVQAGDRYLDEGDPANAARCYGNALSAGEDEDITEADSYLLMAIKLARKKEKD
jgi:hypothetical protein